MGGVVPHMNPPPTDADAAQTKPRTTTRCVVVAGEGEGRGLSFFLSFFSYFPLFQSDVGAGFPHFQFSARGRRRRWKSRRTDMRCASDTLAKPEKTSFRGIWGSIQVGGGDLSLLLSPSLSPLNMNRGKGRNCGTEMGVYFLCFQRKLCFRHHPWFYSRKIFSFPLARKEYKDNLPFRGCSWHTSPFLNASLSPSHLPTLSLLCLPRR